MSIILTKKEVERILNGEKRISTDLGKTETEVEVVGDYAVIHGHRLLIEGLKKIKDNCCYLLEDGFLNKIEIFSEETNIYYKLLPAKDWPTFTLSATPMHRHIHLSPKEDTMIKMKEIAPVKGKILDTCCGSGYTAIMASKNAEEVHTFERDKSVLLLAKLNPYSQELFTSPKIKLHEEDVFEGIKKFKDNYFDRIIHDPPTFKRSPMLYSSEFYSELLRVLKKSGIIYHYAPCPKKTKGEQFHRGIVRRLKEAGFSQVEHHEKSSGVRAIKR